MRKQLTFEQWKRLADLFVQELMAGLGADDLPDWGWHDAYDRGVTPLAAAKAAIRAAKEF